MNELKAYLLCRFAEQSSLYQSWPQQLSVPTVIVDDFVPEWSAPEDAGIIITHLHYRWEEIGVLRRLFEQNRVPILILCDGVLEYRNTWQHPDLPDGSMFQPVCGHKIACLGRAPARVLESWGNVGKCEIVGLPRLDGLLETQLPKIMNSGSQSRFRLLIATATTPAFDDQQLATVIQSLISVQQYLAENSTLAGRTIEIVWRVSGGLNQALGLPEQDRENLPPLSHVIDSVDAVITTPSTIYLESVLRKRPTAILDFSNSPQYVSPAWSISSAEQIPSVIAELAHPPAPKMLFQATTLHDQLECHSPAAPRLVTLIEAMLAQRIRAEATSTTLNFPPRLLTDDRAGLAIVPCEFDLSRLYEHNAIFHQQDTQRLQIELAAAIKRLESLPLEVAEKDRYLAGLKKMHDHARMRIEDMHNRVVSLRERLGIKPE